nr:hypothetical protein [Tanacetum cinerariifolium]
MVELRAYSELKDTIVVVVPKFIGEGYTMSTIRVEYKPVQSAKKTDKAPAKPKVTKATNVTTSNSNSFDALNTSVDEDNCRCMNPYSTQEAEQVEGNGKKDINTSVPSSLYYKPPIGVVSSIHGSSPV